MAQPPLHRTERIVELKIRLAQEINEEEKPIRQRNSKKETKKHECFNVMQNIAFNSTLWIPATSKSIGQITFYQIS